MTFVMASAGTVFGYAWCFGDDGHVEVNYSSGVVCCDEDLENRTAERYIVPTFSRSSGDSCGSCLDVSTPQCGAVFLKRLKQVSSTSVATLATNVFTPKMAQGASLSAKITTFSPRVSPTILAHRTVVLLN